MINWKHVSIFMLFLKSMLCFSQVNSALEVVQFSDQERASWLGTVPNEEFTENYDVTSYQLELNLNPDTLYLSGNVSIHFIATKNLQNVFFNLSNSFVVDSILPNVAYTHYNNLIQVSSTYPANQLDSIRIFYHGNPPLGSNAFVQKYHNGQPVLWSLSEPYGAQDWWPCKQSLSDKADSVTTIITVPKWCKAAGVGRLESEKINPDQTKTFTWKHQTPITNYLIAVAVTNYKEISFQTSLSQGNLPVLNYIYPEDSISSAPLLRMTDTLLQFYDTLLGPYPFMNDKYGHAQFSRGGGMEHQTMSFMTHFKYPLLAHELAHQWFGNKITCNTWSDLWLNESFATYFTGVPIPYLFSENEWVAWKKDLLTFVTSQPDGAVFVADTHDVSRLFDSRLTYSKGALVLHMLRYQLGSSVFFKGIQNYLSDPELAYKTASTNQFFAHMELVSGKDLSTFKNQWIYGEGHPSFHLSWQQNGTKLMLTMKQTTSHGSVPFFYLNVPIRAVSKTGQIMDFSISATYNEQSFIIPVGFEVAEILIDPELNIISKSNVVVPKNNLPVLAVFPNPASDVLHITLSPEELNNSSVILRDLTGKIMLHSLKPSQFNGHQLNVSPLPAGNYLAEINTSKGKYNYVVVIQRP